MDHSFGETMTAAAITAVQAALKTAIESTAEGTFALPLSVLIGDSVTYHGVAASAMRVQLAYTGVAELARTSRLILDQVAIDVDLSCRYEDESQATLNNCHQVAERLRDLLTDFHTAGARVEQLITPSPFDQVRATQGEFQHRLTLDMDLLRTVTTAEAPAVTGNPVLTETREAVWNAINHWEPFANAWTRKYRTAADLAELSLHDPASFELPAIAITWGPTAAEWWTHQMQNWGQQLFIQFWLPADWQAVAEWRLEQLMQAVYQAAPVESPSVSYVRKATGRPPSKNSPITLEMVALGRAQKLHAWRGQIALTLSTNVDPNA